MIKIEYNTDTGEADVKFSGTATILRTEFTAMRESLIRNPEILDIYVSVLEDYVTEKYQEEKK